MAEALALPRRFGRYALFDFIGRGGMAEIYLARAETELGATRLCVVKEILPQLAEDRDFSEMLIHEAKLAARLSHANIVQVFDLGRTEGRLFISMEYVEGYDLNGLLRECTKKSVAMPIEHALQILMDALRGLSYAHRREDDEGKPLGIVHRDVSPSNVLVSLEGEVKLCDFGIAHANAFVRTLDTRADEAIKGKAGYMSPEQARGDAIDARADVFAVGILLWELLAGRRLYRAQGDVPLLEQARRAEVPELPTRDIPGFAGLSAIVTRALARDRDARFESAAAFREALEAWSDEHHVVPSAIRFGQWLVESFGRSAADRRRQRELLLTPSGHMPISPPSRSLGLPGEDGVEPRDLPLPGIPSNVEVAFAAEVSPSAREPATSAENMQSAQDAGEGRPSDDAAPAAGTVPADQAAGLADPVPKPRRAPLVRAVIPSPGAMRVFKELARNGPEEPPLSPSIEILGVPPDKADEKERAEIRRTWVLVGAGIVVLIVAAYFALLRG